MFQVVCPFLFCFVLFCWRFSKNEAKGCATEQQTEGGGEGHLHFGAQVPHPFAPEGVLVLSVVSAVFWSVPVCVAREVAWMVARTVVAWIDIDQLVQEWRAIIIIIVIVVVVVVVGTKEIGGPVGDV